MSDKTGGPAFPCMPPQDASGGSAAGYPYPDAGMTLRDYFAAKAMQGLMGRAWADEKTGKTPENIHAIWAVNAYAMADAMIKARQA